MQNGIGNTIKSIKIYSCGYCTNDIGKVYKGQVHKEVVFEAKALLIEHETQGMILVDTGYSERVYTNGLLSKLYNFLNPTICTREDTLINQLNKDGIDDEDVNYIILSHLHPDHIGGLRDFLTPQIIMSYGSNDVYLGNSFKDILFKNMLPGELSERSRLVETNTQSPLEGFDGLDLFEDGSLWLIDIEGHAKGQLGVFIPDKDLFYIADATWGTQWMNHSLKLVAKLIQYNYKAYKRVLEKLMKLDVKNLISTHGDEVYLDEE